MKFTNQDFACDTETYRLDEKSFIVKFFDHQGEHQAGAITDLGLVDPGYEYLCL